MSALPSDLAAIITEAVNQILGGDPEVLQHWQENKPLLREALRLALLPDCIVTVDVDHTRPPKEMIEAGKYDRVDGGIEFSATPELGVQKGVKIHMIKTLSTTTTEEMLERLRQRGLRRAMPAEVLAIGEQHPDLQTRFPIIALGNGNESSSIGLSSAKRFGNQWRRQLRLYRPRTKWISICRFAAVRI